VTVLIVTHSRDNESVSAVTAAIEESGGRVFRFDTDRFPAEVQLVDRHDGGGRRLTLRDGNTSLDLADVTAVWHRRLNVAGGASSAGIDPLRRASIGEARATVLGTIASLGVFCMDPVPIIRRAESKALQLDIARTVGLDIPRTLITNDPGAVRAFAAECPGGMVAKMLSSFAVVENGIEKVVFTSLVSASDLDDLDGLSACPMAFQGRVPKAIELRATIVGDRVFTASVDSQMLADARIDWRREGAALETTWREYRLPPAVKERLLLLMDQLNLNYGAADFIVTPDGRHVFLEVNPAGEFLWLEQYAGLPISRAIADILLGLAVRRISGETKTWVGGGGS
jgi:glutathione synthase/RimK-type ligase-like ATP-grasp enzyme